MLCDLAWQVAQLFSRNLHFFLSPIFCNIALHRTRPWMFWFMFINWCPSSMRNNVVACRTWLVLANTISYECVQAEGQVSQVEDIVTCCHTIPSSQRTVCDFVYQSDTFDLTSQTWSHILLNSFCERKIETVLSTFNDFLTSTPQLGDWAVHRLWVTVRLQEKDRNCQLTTLQCYQIWGVSE